MDALVLESSVIKIRILPQLGFKMASIEYKPKSKELLFQPSRGQYELPIYGGDFSKYDTSGLDEMMPTIDRCLYPQGDFKGTVLPDHGDVWSLAWDTEPLKDKVIGRVKLKSLPIEFTKTISFSDESTIRMDYRVKNLSDKELYYIWALHGLSVFDDDTEFIFTQEMKDPFNVMSDEDLSKRDLKPLKSYPDKSQYKYYFSVESNKGEVGLDYTMDRIRYLIQYDPLVHPYLGVWITKGGFKGEYNCALEPSNGFYDSLALAYENKKIPLLKARGEDQWTIFIQIKEY